MRKLKLVLYSLMMLHFACESPTGLMDDSGPSLDYEQVSSGFFQVFSESFKMTETLPLFEVLERTEKETLVRVETKSITNATQHYFQQLFKTGVENNIPLHLVSHPKESLETGQKVEVLGRLVDSSKAFNVPQKMYIKWLTKNIAETQDYEQGTNLVAEFRSQVAHAIELSNEEKLILLEIAAGSEALLDFFENGGVGEVQNRIADIMGSSSLNGKIAGCSVNWRSVWLGAVVGFSWGAARGLILGAATGTVAVPVVGTVTGAISGAVTLGAAGFVGGAIGGVTAELIGSCFRSTKFNQVFSSCDQAWDAYLAKRINAMPADCFIVPMGLY